MVISTCFKIIERMATAKKFALYEKMNEDSLYREEHPERLVVLNSDNYLGALYV